MKPALQGYLAVARDRVFLRLVLAALLVWSVEVQISSYLAVRLGSDFPEQRLLSLGSWQVTVDGINVLGILRAPTPCSSWSAACGWASCSGASTSGRAWWPEW